MQMWIKLQINNKTSSIHYVRRMATVNTITKLLAEARNRSTPAVVVVVVLVDEMGAEVDVPVTIVVVEVEDAGVSVDANDDGKVVDVTVDGAAVELGPSVVCGGSLRRGANTTGAG
jgi:hypothetical protein